MTRILSRSTASPPARLALALAPLLLAGCERSVAPARTPFGGTYIGRLATPTSPVGYRMEIPENAGGEFAVRGTFTEHGAVIPFTGTARRDGPAITIELTRATGRAEDLVGLSGQVTASGDGIALLVGAVPVRLERR